MCWSDVLTTFPLGPVRKVCLVNVGGAIELMCQLPLEYYFLLPELEVGVFGYITVIELDRKAVNNN